MKHVPKHIKPPGASKRKSSWSRKAKLSWLHTNGYDIRPLTPWQYRA